MAEVNKMNRSRRTAAGVSGKRRKKRRHGKRTLHYIFIIIFLFAAGITLSLTVFFKVESVTVIGSDKYPPDEIAAASGIEEGENMFRVDTGAVREKLLAKFPYIDTVKVLHKPPHEIQIEVTQCIVSGAVDLGDEYMLITRDGKVLERGIIFIPEHVPMISGLKVGNAKPGDNLAEEAAEALNMLDYLFAAVEETGFGEITNVNLTDLYNMKIIYENRLMLNLGTEAELSSKLRFIKEMLVTGRIPDTAQGLIDASNINRSLIYTEMTIEEAEQGKRRGTLSSQSSDPDEPLQNVDEPVSNADEPAAAEESGSE